jgi:hypothetical protein
MAIDLNAYFLRIGYFGERTPTLETLQAINRLPRRMRPEQRAAQRRLARGLHPVVATILKLVLCLPARPRTWVLSGRCSLRRAAKQKTLSIPGTKLRCSRLGAPWVPNGSQGPDDLS